MRLGLLVTGVTYRHPGLLAKTVATLDVLSGGRAQLGIGAAWYEREHRALGVPFPPVAERFEQLEETLQICMQMWSDDDGPFEGRHYQLAETMCSPRPISAPRPPILIGGGGERKTLRLVARYADACNLFAFDPDEIAHKLEVLTQHCRTEGRDPDTVERTIVFVRDPFDDVDGFVAAAARYASLGVTTIDVVPTGDPVAFVERVGTALIPPLAALAVAARAPRPISGVVLTMSRASPWRACSTACPRWWRARRATPTCSCPASPLPRASSACRTSAT